jgi:hypothetical protein
MTKEKEHDGIVDVFIPIARVGVQTSVICEALT